MPESNHLSIERDKGHKVLVAYRDSSGKIKYYPFGKKHKITRKKRKITNSLFNLTSEIKPIRIKGLQI